MAEKARDFSQNNVRRTTERIGSLLAYIQTDIDVDLEKCFRSRMDLGTEEFILLFSQHGSS